MRILITNDDGINAPGFAVLEAIAGEVAGPDGEVWVVAPAFEQSGVGHAITYTRPMALAKFAPQRFAAEGTPADCVLAGLGEVMDERPDLILSGVNRGNNAAENALYSGTLGAAIEGALQGIPSIALSQFIGPENLDPEVMFTAAAQHGAKLVKTLVEGAPWQETADYQLFYNVNFPPFPGEQVAGIRATTQGFRPDSFFGTEATTSPHGRRFLWVKGGPQHGPTDPGSDAAANLEGYISVVPMRADLTARDVMGDLEALFE